MELPRDYPFNRLRMPAGERALWRACNPTFHRGYDYGIVLTDRAVYLRSWVLSALRRWKRIPYTDIRQVRFRDSRLFPCLEIATARRIVRFRTPFDSYDDEMDWDRERLIEAACFITHRRAAGPPRP